MVHARPRGFADGDTGRNSRSPINRSAVAPEPCAGAQAFCRRHRDRTRTTAYFTRSNNATPSRGDESGFNKRVRLPALDAPGKCVPCDCARGMERRPPGNTCDGPFGIRSGNFTHHALRCCCYIAWLSRTGGRHLLYRLRSMVAITGNGIFASPFLFSGAYVWPTHFWPTQHGERGLLRNSRWSGRRFCDSYAGALSPGTRRWRVTSSGYRYVDCKTWTRSFFRRAHDCGRISGSDTERLDELRSTRSTYRNWYFPRRPVYVLDFVSVRSRVAGTATS